MHVCTVHGPTNSIFSNFFIKNRSHDTIHTFKNYFATVFSISVFSFSKNKLNPNGSKDMEKQALRDFEKIAKTWLLAAAGRKELKPRKRNPSH